MGAFLYRDDLDTDQSKIRRRLRERVSTLCDLSASFRPRVLNSLNRFLLRRPFPGIGITPVFDLQRHLQSIADADLKLLEP